MIYKIKYNFPKPTDFSWCQGTFDNNFRSEICQISDIEAEHSTKQNNAKANKYNKRSY